MASKVCIYAIAKNEAQFVDRFMDSVKDADLVIIGDTGSTDDTIERFKRRGAVVHSITVNPWRFDVARNKVIDLVPFEYDCLFSIDIDEIITTPNWKQLLLQGWQNGKCNRIRYNYTWALNPDGTPHKRFRYDKIHSRDFRWVSPCHEVLQITPPVVESGGFVELEVVHKPDPSKSRGCYLDLLALAVNERPDDDRILHYYARELYFRHQWADSLVQLKKHIAVTNAWSAERAASCRYAAECSIQLGDYPAVDMYYRQAIEICPNERESYIAYARYLQKLGKHEECYKHAKHALTITHRHHHYLEDEQVWAEAPYDLAGVSAYYMDLYTESLELCEKALALNPNDKRLQDNVKLVVERLSKTTNVTESTVKPCNKLCISYWNAPFKDPLRQRLHEQGIGSIHRFNPTCLLPITRQMLQRSSKQDYGLERDLPYFTDLLDLAASQATDDSWLIGFFNSDCIWPQVTYDFLKHTDLDAVLLRTCHVALDITLDEVDAGKLREANPSAPVGWDAFFIRPSVWRSLKKYMPANMVIGEPFFDQLFSELIWNHTKAFSSVRGLIHPLHKHYWDAESPGGQHNTSIYNNTVKGQPSGYTWYDPIVTLPLNGFSQFRKQKIISFSLWGNDPKYTQGAIENVRLAHEIYPEWICRFYIDDSVDAEVVRTLQGLGAQIVKLPQPNHLPGVCWRFMVNDDGLVDRYLIRDADSRLNWRERAAVDAWLTSDFQFHTMHDHPGHVFPVAGGMWGGRTGIVLDMTGTMRKWVSIQGFDPQHNNDQHFLAKFVWPIMQASCLHHVGFCNAQEGQLGSRKVWPVHRPLSYGTFVGEVFDADNQPNTDHLKILQQYIGQTHRRIVL